MDEPKNAEPVKRICAGLLAHVDAGKTTLSEALLYKAGKLRKPGRVDHGDSFLDSEPLERSRGITIFSKQARLSRNGTDITLLDTPGHVDFAAETERALSAVDCGILVISANEGVQPHTETLWKLLRRYRIPVFIFVNKMDLAIYRKEEILGELRTRLGVGCVDFRMQSREALEDALTLNSEALTEAMLTEGTLSDEAIASAVSRREIYPCYFGSALKCEGIDALLDGLVRFAPARSAGEKFGARVFKVARDENGERITFVRITGGQLAVRDTIDGGKVHQIRLYSGMKYRTVEQAEAGMICGLTGLTLTKAGMGLGAEEDAGEEILEPFLSCHVRFPDGVDAHRGLQDFRQLAEEDPKLDVSWDEAAGAVAIRMMGQVQLEVLTHLAEERFGYRVEFDSGKIVYKETMMPEAETVEGVGHFEPLHHYAEVHLLLEPGERGSGMTFLTDCPEDELDRNWQRLILTHLRERQHRGVLIGAPVTDLKITLAAGKSHQKHTEGGDFREATYRAVRQGLMQADCCLLEPWFEYRLEVPAENTGRAMADVKRMHGSFQEPERAGEMTVLRGKVPVSEMSEYSRELQSYTGGRGRLNCILSGYERCHNEKEIIEAAGYCPERDVENTADSVFCFHGGSEIVSWRDAPAHMHLPPVLAQRAAGQDAQGTAAEQLRVMAREYSRRAADDRELMAIFERTYGPVKQNPLTAPGATRRKRPERTGFEPVQKEVRKVKTSGNRRRFVLVDGYNLIHAWPELAELAKTDFGASRDRLIEILCNYQGFTQAQVIVVFDAYRVRGGTGSRERVRNIDVIYTKEAETADMYIERVTHEIAKENDVRVVTSDGLEQMIILGHGATRTSSREFVEEIRLIDQAIRDVMNTVN
ncbi:translation factor GTPase family protein [Hornefia butyriciproducens]|uniref:translation factor GTPase family protein n=1 Tax=Hornefia butyriciproducens TaxID=2652293 RepID=UPI002A908D8C|nr:translation factor GTPase family protein [Hornefia butyriciproducens]MDY5422908.1 translation factor GTPase family protein [Hornefia butyriciproducens]